MFLGDLRYALRALARNRSFTIAAVLSLGLGIGLNTAVFGFTNAVLLRPFPYRDADRLVAIWGTKSFDVRRGMNGEDVENWRLRSDAFVDVAVFQINSFPFSPGDSATETIQGALIGTRVLPLLGAPALLGRTFSEIDEEPGGDKRVMLSYGFWQSHFGADVGVVGKSIQLNGELYSIIGVMPRGFFFPDQHMQIWVPLTRAMPMFKQVQGLARLRPGVTLGEAQTEIDTISRSMQATVGDGIKVYPGVFPLHIVVIGKYRAALWTLLGAVTLLLLIACANMSQLLLARAVGRERELAVRASLGATPVSILRLLLLESILLSLIAGAFGILCARWGVLLLRSLRLVDIPRIEFVSLDSRVLLFALVLSLATGARSGILPAWNSARPNLLSALQLGGTSTNSPSHSQLRDLLVTIEVGLALVLLVGAGLLINSFVRLSHADWGFSPDHVLLVEVRVPGPIVQVPSRQVEITNEVLERLSKVPGVSCAAMAIGVPIKYAWRPTQIAIDGRFVSADWTAATWIVSAGYFQTMRIPVLRGREFSQRDDELAPRAVLVSKNLAEKLWPGKNPAGKLIQILKLKKDIQDRLRKSGTNLLDQNTWRSEASWQPNGSAWEVIGEVDNVRAFGLDTNPDPALYVNYRQEGTLGEPVERFVVRTSTDPLRVAPAVKDQILTAEKELRIDDIKTMSDLVSQSIGGRGSNKLLLVVSTLFGSLSLLLAASGIYGVVSFVVAQRLREIGIRGALGARPPNILCMIMIKGMRPVLLGLSFGLVGSFALSRLLKGLLFGVTTTDPLTFVGISFSLVVVACAACLMPALRALRVDPSETLRYE
jgi:putative ABC transport system permease protein